MLLLFKGGDNFSNKRGQGINGKKRFREAASNVNRLPLMPARRRFRFLHKSTVTQNPQDRRFVSRLLSVPSTFVLTAPSRGSLVRYYKLSIMKNTSLLFKNSALSVLLPPKHHRRFRQNTDTHTHTPPFTRPLVLSPSLQLSFEGCCGSRSSHGQLVLGRGPRRTPPDSRW